MPWTFFLFDSSEILIRSIKSINRGSPKIQALWKKYSTQLKNEGSSAVGIPWRRSGIFQVPSQFVDEVCKEAAQRCVLIKTCPLNTVTISVQNDSYNRENKVGCKKNSFHSVTLHSCRILTDILFTFLKNSAVIFKRIWVSLNWEAWINNPTSFLPYISTRKKEKTRTYFCTQNN